MGGMCIVSRCLPIFGFTAFLKNPPIFHKAQRANGWFLGVNCPESIGELQEFIDFAHEFAFLLRFQACEWGELPASFTLTFGPQTEIPAPAKKEIPNRLATIRDLLGFNRGQQPRSDPAFTDAPQRTRAAQTGKVSYGFVYVFDSKIYGFSLLPIRTNGRIAVLLG